MAGETLKAGFQFNNTTGKEEAMDPAVAEALRKVQNSYASSTYGANSPQAAASQEYWSSYQPPPQPTTASQPRTAIVNPAPTTSSPSAPAPQTTMANPYATGSERTPASDAVLGGKSLTPVPGDSLRKEVAPAMPGQPGTPFQNNAAPAPAAAGSTYQPPLSLYGHPAEEQARMLTDYLKSQGVNIGTFVLGGKSPHDDKINYLIDRINDPNATPAQRQQYARDIGGLIELRNKSFETGGAGPQPQPIGYDPTKDRIGPAPGLPGSMTPNDFINRIYNPTDPGSNLQRPTPSLDSNVGGGETGASARDRLLGELSRGGVGNDEYRRTAEARLIDSAENSAKSRRQNLADNLNRSGIYGGAAADQLSDFDMGVLGQRTEATRDLELGLADREQQAKTTALSAFLQQQGMDAAESQLMARLIAEAQSTQAQLASQYDLGSQGLGLTERNQDMYYITTLLELAARGDESAKQKVMQLLGLTQNDGAVA